ncbi:MAG: type IV toxin-antitoxin system AbiEi family antitoxin domain-containing protein [Patulibacter sp.]|nr:type IV toxin-antitoxin system AbiEi family antitoxin domain-containing protein [Patulibacter sp.]
MGHEHQPEARLVLFAANVDPVLEPERWCEDGPVLEEDGKTRKQGAEQQEELEDGTASGRQRASAGAAENKEVKGDEGEGEEAEGQVGGRAEGEFELGRHGWMAATGTGYRNESLSLLRLTCRVYSVGQAGLMTTERLREQFGARPFRVAEAIAAGASRTTLHRMREAGELVPVSRGVLQLPDEGMGMQSPLAAVSARAPGGTICLNSALAFWDLTDEIPTRIHLAVPRGAHRPAINEPSTRVHVFAAETFSLERQQASTDADEPFWTYSPERSVVDAIRLARWVGHDVGLRALRRYVARSGSKPERLVELARELGGGARLGPALEVLLS